ncbi:hypothetical protein ACFSKI_16300 [Pseudogracilibacillus auburnensis]|uniref:SLAP domain-containing protein n=1 Tax=Pseudogracilibacillus auburnensis TaxID=1494959 RepID=A0A2V3W901_9BACI|nr:hypothetical protein [Pseudogracilibacillus auburnensis]MBO1001605.1 hypothetical protein [Pseudogracilibacillus auburnensis]PXW89471.1 hypothetical protein DFR56_102248 [Pseudogracilibacillus auburnensis]
MLILVLILTGCMSIFGDDEKKTNKVEDNATSEETNAEDADKKDEELNSEKDESEEKDRDATAGEKADLTLQVTKVDADDGITIENNDIYQQLDQMVKENPQDGDANDFSLFLIDFVEFEDDELQLLFLGINRLDKPIKNISFDFTLGYEDGEYVWEDLNVSIPEDEFGAIKVDHAMPILLPVTEEQIEIINEINFDNQIFEMENFDFETE